ncbi:DUF1835 domain-containing protein [Clostridium saccharobutylicum]|uniref:DUF1835 domain-containing protein n=1 Tax=Clostridium saccharobutylicum TaxID=169679 RepID=A0A1S8MZ21_CLOSA|nr:DUF1835 domain-containing protein [Clostridium saccharobutylicum]OOM09425.1 hypothetical protein CLOSAC_37060 [Clostridium saccharobutylicum]
MSKIVHIVYSQSAEGSFKQAIKKEVIQVDKLIALYDNLSNGEINNLEDINNRKAWWKELNGEDHYLYDETNELEANWKKFYEDISAINEGDTVYLWYGNCNREICGMMYTIYLLKDKDINIYIVDVSCKITENSNGRVVILSSASEIFYKKLGVYLEVAQQIEVDEYKKLLNQWNKLTKENSLLRSYKNGEMLSVSEGYFDKDILKYTDREYKKAPRIVGSVLGNAETKITDDYVFWRIKELVKLGPISFKGNFGIMREMELCITDTGIEYLRSFPEDIEFWNNRRNAETKKLEFIDEIKEQGRLEERIKIAKKLLDVLDMETIADKTGLTVGQVKNLQVEG